MLRTSILLTLLTFGCFFTACNKEEIPPESEFTLEDEIALGERLHALIQDENSAYEVINQDAYPAIKAFLSDSKNRLTSSGLVQNRDRFDWEIHVLRGNNKNSFVLPGGFIYIYADLAKQNIKTGAACLGVLAHEVALADQSHATSKLKENYSLSLLLDVALGNNEMAAIDLIDDIINEPYSFEATQAADELAINLLCPTDVKVGDYLDFVQSESNASSSTWLKTHPNYDNRTPMLDNMSDNCSGTESFEYIYTQFVNQL